MDTWYGFNCPSCEAYCLFYAGDASDMTGFGPEDVVCWNCDNIWKIEDYGDVTKSKRKEGEESYPSPRNTI